VLGIVSERRSNLVNAKIDTALKIHKGLVIPEGMPDFFASDHLAGAPGKQGQNSKGLKLQLNKRACLAQFAAPEIQLEDPKAEQRWGRAVNHPHLTASEFILQEVRPGSEVPWSADWGDATILVKPTFLMSHSSVV
jgi:hypothetical protein